MAKQFPAIDAKHREFIEAQQMFFVATAAESGRVNLSPKGKDAFRVLGANRILKDAVKHKGHWVVCLGCQQAMATHTILHDLIHNITNAFICSSVGGEYAAMSMSVTRELNVRNYARYGIRYNAPLLDLTISASLAFASGESIWLSTNQL